MRNRVVEKFLLSMGISPSLSGFTCLYDAIRYVLKNSGEFPPMIKLYKIVGDRLSKTPYQVERNMRHAIEYAFAKTRSEELYKVFGSLINQNTGKVDNSTFLHTCVYELEPMWFEEKGDN